MKIGLILSGSPKPSMEHYNNQEIGLAKALLRFGVETDVFWYAERTRGIEEQKLSGQRTKGVTILEYPGLVLPFEQVFSLSLLKYLVPRLRDYSLIQVYDQTYILSFVIALLCHIMKVPCVLCQGRYGAYPELSRRIIQKMYDWTVTRVFLGMIDLAIGKTRAALEYLHDNGLRPSCRSRVIHMGLDIESFKTPGENADGGRKIDQESIDVLYVGKFEKRRYVTWLIELFKELRAGNEHLRFVMAGDGPENQLCQKLVKKYCLEGNVVLMGEVPQKELPDIYRRSKMVLLPTAYEIYGMVLLEAMYFGVPVIASRQAGPAEIIENGKDGIILDVLTVPLWADTIKDLLAKENYRSKLGCAAREKILREFLWDTLGEEFHAEYSALCSRQQHWHRPRNKIFQ